MAIEIVPLANADIPAAVECVQNAFSDDPFFRWAFNDPSKVWNLTVEGGATYPGFQGL